MQSTGVEAGPRSPLPGVSARPPADLGAGERAAAPPKSTAAHGEQAGPVRWSVARPRDGARIFGGAVLVLGCRWRFDLRRSLAPTRELQNGSPPLNLRKTLLTSAVLLAAVLPSCQSTNRAGKDLFIVAASPVLIPYGGFADGHVSATEVAKGMGGGELTGAIAYPFTVTYHLIKHTLVAVHHALDFVVYPVYGAAEIQPYGPEIMPLDYYSGTWFDENAAAMTKKKSGTDAETGEPIGR